MADTPRGARTSPRRHGRSRGGVGQAVRGLAALVVLLALCVGIPVALVALTSTSFPAGAPSLPRIFAGLTQHDDGSLFLAVLSVAGWVGWATFTVAVLLEIPAQMRGVPSVRVRGLGAQQALAGGLIAAVLTVLLVPSAANAADRAAGGAGAALSAGKEHAISRSSFSSSSPAKDPHGPSSTPQPATHRSDRGTPPPASGEEYLVRPGDTLWDIATARLGVGTRWREIAALNYGRRQPDGAHLNHSHVLRPGWRLILPAWAGEPGRRHARRIDTPHPGEVALEERIVRAGDTLSEIALQELGDADRYPELMRSSGHILQPGGRHLSDPDRIYPGWTLDIPGAHRATPAASSRSSPARPPGSPAAPPPSARPVAGAAAPAGSPSGRVETDGPPDPARPEATAAARSGHSSVAAVPSPVSSIDDESSGSLLDDVLDVRTVGGVGALLAASLVLLLRARRSRQQRRRRPGERIRLPPRPALDAEARLRAVADPAGVGHVDLALRALAAEHRVVGRPLPALRAARLTAAHLELYLCEPARLAQPWVPTSDPTVWAMNHDDLRIQPETDMRAPFPGLVTLGHDLDDAHVLVDLEHLTALAVQGRREDTLPVLAGLAVELATSPWADDLLVTLVGCLSELPNVVATGRLRHVDRVEALIGELEGRAEDVERVLRNAGADSLAAARGTGVADDAWPPEIVILADDVPEPLRDRLERVLYRVPRVGLAAVTAGGTPLGEWRLALQGASGAARLEPIGLTIRPQRLGGTEYGHVLDVLKVADEDAIPGPSWAAHMAAREPALADLPEAAEADVPSEPVLLEETAAADRTSGTDRAGRAEPGVAAPAEAGADEPADVVRLPGRPPFVRLFGTVEVVGALGPEPVTVKDGRAVASHLARATALVAYLACRPDGATVEQVSEALSPVRRLSPSTVWSLASRTRKWLGSDPDGVPYFPRTSDAGSNRLHPAVRTDWALWLDLVGNDVTTTPLDRLMEALDLVRGRPFESVPDRHYTWAEPLRQDMIAGVVDVAHEVVRRALLVPDLTTARRAAIVGRVVDSANELIWRDALRVEYVAGNREAQRRLIEQLYAMADGLETDLEPETEQLIVELERPSLPRAASR